MALAVACAAAVAAADWRRDGEAVDAAVLSRPALSQSIVSAVNSAADSTYLAGSNPRFRNVTLAEAKRMLLTLQSEDALPKREAEISMMPQEFDWREDTRAMPCPDIGEVRDQANCAAAWAVVPVSALADRVCVGSKGERRPHLSAQDPLSCVGGMGCGGGTPAAALRYIVASGVVTGGNYGDSSGCWAYQLSPACLTSPENPGCDWERHRCHNACIDNPERDWQADKWYGEAAYSVCGGGDGSSCEDGLAQELFVNGPVVAQFTVHQSFLHYRSGVYQQGTADGPMLGVHTVKLIGFGNDGDTPYWLAVNSWGPEWGSGGFFKIKRGSNECRIEDPTLNGGPLAVEPKL